MPTTTKKSQKKPSVRERIEKVLKRRTPASKRWHPEGLAAALVHRAESDARILNKLQTD